MANWQHPESGQIALMGHVIADFPDKELIRQAIAVMADTGVRVIEIQIPFSEPMADGPLILKANSDALSTGARVERSLEIAEQITRRFDIPFLFMTYYNGL